MARRDETGRRRRVTRRVEAAIDGERGVFMISVAAELADMHPQTLRMYETRGLITPKRSPKKTRLYSQNDVERDMNAEVERVRRSLKTELVPYGAYDTADLVPAEQPRPIRIPVRRPRKSS